MLGFEKSGRGLKALGAMKDALKAFIAAGGSSGRMECASSRNRLLLETHSISVQMSKLKLVLACAVKLRIDSRERHGHRHAMRE